MVPNYYIFKLIFQIIKKKEILILQELGTHDMKKKNYESEFKLKQLSWKLLNAEVLLVKCDLGTFKSFRYFFLTRSGKNDIRNRGFEKLKK